ncbi:hypothetical protein [Streptomyces sp. NPDC006463]|uniref:hypothetical protein n=1 Tax=Streptomyces sp. NPDC006463 TaxID=3364746 RepID=UPI0036835C7B
MAIPDASAAVPALILMRSGSHSRWALTPDFGHWRDFARSLERVDKIGAFQLGRVRLAQVPPNRLAALARYGLGSKAASLERAEEPKRTAMLTAVMRHLEAKAIDEALDLFQVLMATRLTSTAKRATEKERLSTLPKLEKASRMLARAAKVRFEELELVETHGVDLDAAALWATVEEVAPRQTVMTAAALVVSLVPEDRTRPTSRCGRL